MLALETRLTRPEIRIKEIILDLVLARRGVSMPVIFAKRRAFNGVLRSVSPRLYDY